MGKRLIFLDCDSTLSSIEGIDELARLRGEGTFEECANMTNRAMDGEIPIEAVYGERLKLINPTREECAIIGQQYIDTMEPHVQELIAWLKANGWLPVIVSGGLTQVIEPFAKHLGIEELQAVDLVFKEDGTYASFKESCPTSRMGGKIEVIEAAKKTGDVDCAVMVGDGVSDLETQENVDLFIGYGRVVAREKVKTEAKRFIMSLDKIPTLLQAQFHSL